MPELCKRCSKSYEPSPGSYLKLCPSCEGAAKQVGYDSTTRTSLQVLDGTIELLAIFLIAFTPMVFGATERWSKLVAELAIFAMCGLWLCKGILKHNLAFVKTPLNLLVCGFIVLACLQLVPLPKALSARLSPVAMHESTGTLPGANKSAQEVLAPAASAPDSYRARCVSANPAGSKSMLFMITCYATAFIVVINVVRRRSQIARLLTAVIVVGFIVAAMGILGHAAPNGKILWFKEPPSGAIWFGPFVNRNHFAGYLVMATMVALGMLMATRNREKKILLGFVSAVMMAAVLLSASRGGVASLAVGCAAFCVLLIATHSARKNMAPLAAVVCLALAAALAMGIGPIVSRTVDLAAPTGDEYRWAVWKDTARMVADFPVLGVGLGAFRSLFPIYKTVPEQLTFTHVENDYLQLLVETGIAGFAIGIAFLALVFRSVLRSLRIKRSTYTRGIMIGLTAAATGMVVHSFVDFNLHVPSNGLLFALVMGLLVVLSSLHVSKTPAKTSWIGQPADRLLNGETVAAPGMLGAFAASVACLCLLAFCTAGRANGYLAQRDLDSVERQAMSFVKGEGNFNVVDGIRKVQAATKRDNENGEWRFRAGIFYQTLAQIKRRSADASNASGSQYLYSLAINEFKRACNLDYFNGRYQASLAIALSERACSGGALEPGSPFPALLPAADRAFRMAIGLDPTNAWAARKYGEMVWETDRALAQRAFRRSLALDPHYTKTELGMLAEKTNDVKELAACVPDTTEARFELASFLSNNHLPDESEKVLLSLLPSVEADPSKRQLGARVFFELGQIRQDRGGDQDAMAYFLKAVTLEPGESVYYEELGYTCLRQKRYKEAKSFLEQRLRMGAAKDGTVFLALGEIYENVGPADTARQYYRRALDAFPPSWDVSRGKAVQGIQRTSEE